MTTESWPVCGTCGGYGYALPGEESDWGWSGRCTDCAHGLVPPDGMVEAAAKAIFEKIAFPMLGLNDRIHVKDIWRLAARAALVAAARWEARSE